MSDPSRSENATPKRLREARERGEIPRSRELATAVVIASSVMALGASGEGMAQQALEWMRAALSFNPQQVQSSPEAFVARFAQLTGSGFMIVMPLLGATLASAVIGTLMLGGWNFSVQALKPNFGRLNPLSGFGRIFSAHGLSELLKGLLKASLLGALSSGFIVAHRDEILALGRADSQAAIAGAMALLVNILTWLTGGLLVIAAIDAPYQWFAHAKRLRMTKQEVRDEYKNSEGNPEVKGRIRRLQYERSRQRMIAAVPTADVVVVNPQHYAVALQYKPDKMRAPRLVAKGVDEVALAIRSAARDNQIPIIEAPPLARALYRGAKLNQEIPVELYAAVAQVLSYVYQLRDFARRAGTRTAPPRLPDLGEVPNGQPDPPT